MKFKARDIARNAIVAALYAVLALITYPVSFGLYQFRLAEILVFLCFFRRDYVFGLTIGCAIVNLFSFELGPIDALIGSLATLIACLLVSFCKHLWVAGIIPVIVNGFVVGFELYYFLSIPFWTATAFVALGELGAMIIGYIIFMLLKKRKKFFEFMSANRNLEFRC